MADWLDERLKQFLAQREAEQLARRSAAELEAHKNEVLRRKARGLLDDLTARVKRDFERYDEHFRNEPERHVSFAAKPSGGFTLSKNHYPTVQMESALADESRAIRAEYVMTLSAAGTPHHQTVDVILDVDGHDNLSMNVGKQRVETLEDLSRILIERVLFA
jgi:hypothetical protein